MQKLAFALDDRVKVKLNASTILRSRITVYCEVLGRIRHKCHGPRDKVVLLELSSWGTDRVH